MTFTPRYYQTDAVQAVFDYWAEEPGHPLVDMATGCGKSGTIAISPFAFESNRTLVVAPVMVLAMMFGIMPFLQRRFGRFVATGRFD